MGTRQFEWTVNDNYDRLDHYLTTVLPEISRRQARMLCSEGLVTVDGYIARGGQALDQGSRVEVSRIPFLTAARPELGVGLKVYFDDQYLAIVEKPRSMHSVTLRAEDCATLADSVARLFGMGGSPDPREAGLVQRLDYFTSGIVLVGKTKDSWQKLHEHLLSGKVVKHYLALVEGDVELDKVTITLPINTSKRLVEIDNTGIDSVSCSSEVQVLRRYDTSLTLVRVKAARAKRHQIRVHLAAIGHPLVGDTNYGASKTLGDIVPHLSALTQAAKQGGFMLHAEQLSLDHPKTGDRIEFYSSDSELVGLI